MNAAGSMYTGSEPRRNVRSELRVTEGHASLKLLFDLENMLAASFQADVGTFADVSFNEKVMSVGGIEAGHVAYFAPAAGKPPTLDGAFQTPDGAVPPTSIG